MCQDQNVMPLIPREYSNKNGYIYKITKKGEKPICQTMYVSKRIRDEKTHDEKYLLTYADRQSNDMQSIVMPGTLLTQATIERLAGKGVPLHSVNKTEVLDYLIEQKEYVPVELRYSDVGWHVNQNGLMSPTANGVVAPNQTDFLAAELIPAPSHSQNVTGKNDGMKYNLVPSGSYQVWTEMYMQFIRGRTPLEFAVVLGLTAALIPILNAFNPDLKNLLCHISGQSTSGKTTMAQLAVSVAGDPVTSRGLMKTWSTTQNAMTIGLDGNNGIPVVYDELSMAKQMTLTSLVYQLVDGTEKSRATQNATLKSPKNWSTTLISTGEMKLSDQLAGNDGLLVRLLEINDVQFTESAAHSEAIKQSISQNYGWLLPEFVRYLQTQSMESLRNVYTRASTKIKEKLPTSKFQTRLASKLAVFPTTAHFMNQSLNMQIDIDKLCEFIVENMNSDWAIPVGQRALEEVIEYVISVQTSFRLAGLPYVTTRKLLGSIRLEDNFIVVNIIRGQMLAILADLGYQDTSTIFKDWKSEGVLIADCDRKTHRVNLSGERTTVYTLHISREYLEDFVQLKAMDDEEQALNTGTGGNSNYEK